MKKVRLLILCNGCGVLWRVEDFDSTLDVCKECGSDDLDWVRDTYVARLIQDDQPKDEEE